VSTKTKDKYEPRIIQKIELDSCIIQVVEDTRCSLPFLVYGFYFKKTDSGATLKSRPLLWGWYRTVGEARGRALYIEKEIRNDSEPTSKTTEPAKSRKPRSTKQ
jgi:hypothetical protein